MNQKKDLPDGRMIVMDAASAVSTWAIHLLYALSKLKQLKKMIERRVSRLRASVGTTSG